MYNYINFLILVFQIIILFYFFATNLIYTLFALLSLKSTYEYAFVASKVKIRRILSDTFYKPISIIVPAFNEQETIIASVTSLSHLHYPEFEIIVVNDGSRDKTLERLIEEFRLIRVDKPVKIITNHKPLKDIYVSDRFNNLIVINKDNGGKSDALNAGINVSKYPIFCCIDADSLLENDALLRGVSHFIEDQEVVAVGGVVKILNGCKTIEGIVTEIKSPKSFIEFFQSIEYTRGFLSGRTAWNSINHSLMVISGAFGLFRKDLVLAIKGYRHTPGEDMDLVVRLHKHCSQMKMKYKIVSMPVPVCFTQVPSDLNSLIKQRNRWHRGLIDSLIHSREIFFNPRYGVLGMFTFPYFVLIEALGPLIEFIGYASVILFYLLGYLSFDFAILFFIISILWALLITLASLLIDSMLSRKNFNISNIIFLCIFAFLENIGYRQLLILERLFATFQFSKKKWGEIKRQNISVSKYSESYPDKTQVMEPSMVNKQIHNFVQQPEVVFTPGQTVLPIKFILPDKITNTFILTNRQAKIIWSYGFEAAERILKLNSVEITWDRTFLISDSQTVFLVDPKTKKKLWVYISNANSAVKLKNDNILISERDNCRVIEVTTAKNIIWEHRYFSAVPHFAKRLSNGNTLITYCNSHFIMEVNPKNEIVWVFGVPGESANDEKHLCFPEHATRLKDGNTLISDTENCRVIEVSPTGEIVWDFASFTGQKLFKPYFTTRFKGDNTLISQKENPEVIEINYEQKEIWRLDN